MEDTAQTFPPSAPRTRVLLVDDSRDVNGALAMFFATHSNLGCVGELDCADGLVEEVVQRRPGVVVLGLTMPGDCSLGAIRALAALVTSRRVIAHSGFTDPATRKEVRRAGAWKLVGKGELARSSGDYPPGRAVRALGTSCAVAFATLRP